MKQIVVLSVLVLLAGMAAVRLSFAQPPSNDVAVAQAWYKAEAQVTTPTPPKAKTSFFGLSPTAATIVAVAIFLVVILMIVRLTNPPRRVLRRVYRDDEELVEGSRVDTTRRIRRVEALAAACNNFRHSFGSSTCRGAALF